jgi:triacylglycerol lipase
MAWLARDLRQAGFITVNQGYPSRREGLVTLSSYVGRALSRCRAEFPDQRPIHVSFVTHSMGAILLRQYFSDAKHMLPAGLVPHRAVLLGPPNAGSEIVDRWGPRWYFRIANGPAGQALGTDSRSAPNTLATLPLQFAVIAGQVPRQNWLLPKLPMPHDGKVSVASTHLDGESAHRTLAVSHTWLPTRAVVRKHVIFFLRHGIFPPENAP